jgi:hypothetical protein
LAALTVRVVSRLALRQTEGLIGPIIHLHGLTLAVPDHTTLGRRAETLEMPRPRPRNDGKPIHPPVGSIGLKHLGSGEWLIEKHGTKTRRSWRKLHIGVDADTGFRGGVDGNGRRRRHPGWTPCSTKWRHRWRPVNGHRRGTTPT